MSSTNYASGSLLALIGAGLAAGGGVQAAEQGDASAEAISEIVVTAQKREERLQDVPVAVTVVSAAQMQAQHVYSISDLARASPSLEIVQAFGGPGGGGQVRGIGTQSFTRSAEGAVGIVVDGVPQGNVNISNIFDMQRIEVLKGPQGTLFGLTSSAGVINMVTADPDFTKFEVKAHLDYSDNRRFGSEFGEETLRAVANLPLGGISGLRLSVTDDRTKGVQFNNNTHTDDLARDWSVRARWRLKPSDDLEVNLIGDYDRRSQNYSDPQFVYVYANPDFAQALGSCGIVASFENQARCGRQANDFNSRNYGFSAQVDWSLGPVMLTSISGYRKNIAAPSDADIMGFAGDFFQIFYDGQISSARQFSQELRVASQGHQAIEYVAGVFYSDYLAQAGYSGGGAFNVGTYDLAPFFINFAKSAVYTNTTNKSQAVFGQATWHLTEDWGLIAGARYTHQRLTDQSSADPYTPATLPAYGEVEQNNVSGKLGVQYKLSSDLTTYATVTRGYKGPQVIPASQGTPQSEVGAEIPMAYEIGIKGTALDRRVNFDADLFYSRVRDYQGQRCSLNPVGVLVCIGQSVPEVTTKGVEFDVFGQVLPGLNVNLGYIYDQAEYPSGWTGYDPNNLLGGTTDLSHQQLVGVPKNKFTLSADYALRFAGSIEGFVSADTVYKSALRLGPSADPRFIYSAHFNTGARIGVRSPDGYWSVALFARNIGRDHEPVTLFGGPSFTPPGVNPAAPLGYVNGISGWQTPNSLRQVGISIDGKW